MTTPPLDLPALKEIAKAANTGPWESKQGAISPGKKVVGPREARDIGRGPIVIMQPIFWDKRSAVNADHIAAFDPPTVLALLNRAEAAEAKVARVRQIVDNDGIEVDTRDYGAMLAVNADDISVALEDPALDGTP